MDFSEKWGIDVEEAVKLALIDLKLTRDEVEVTVLEEPSKGFFGLGSKLARVRVEKKKLPEPKPEPKPTSKPVQAKTVKKEKDKRENRTPNTRLENKSDNRKKSTVKKEPEENLVLIEEHPAIDFLRETTEKMGLSLQITAKQGKETLYLDIQGKDSGTVIGKRGQTLDAIQYLTSLVVNKDNEKHSRVVVDAENYRAKRERTLEQLAARLADKVVKTKRSVRLEPMNPYERKVIHASLQPNTLVTTRSEGEEPYRRVIIELK